MSRGGHDGPAVGPVDRHAARSRTLAGLFSRAIGLRVTVILLLAVMLATALGAFVPSGGELLGSWWYSTLLGLIAVQTALCAVSRARAAFVQSVYPGRFRPGDMTTTVVAADLGDVTSEARRLGYRSVAVPSGGVGGSAGSDAGGDAGSAAWAGVSPPAVMVKGRLQPLGFLVLHAGLVLLLCGLIWNLQAGTTRSFFLSTGERVLDRGSGRQFEVAEVRADARPAGEGADRRWEVTGLEADVRVYEGSTLVEQGTLRLGAPLGLDDAELVLLPALGRYQVDVSVASPGGRRLVAPLTSGSPEVAAPGGEVVVRVEDFAADAETTPEGEWVRGGPLLQAPLAEVAMIDAASGAVLTVADLRPGETVGHAGYAVTLVGARYVPQVTLSSRSGRWAVLWGGIGVVVGMVLSLAFSYRLLLVEPVDGGVAVGGYARRRHQPLAEELRALLVTVGTGSPDASERVSAEGPEGAGDEGLAGVPR